MMFHCILAAAAIVVESENPADFWNREELFKTPDYRECTAPESAYPGEKPLLVSGKGPDGAPAEFFCYYGVPEGKTPENGWPGVVLVHGGRGTSYPQFVKAWMSLGFAVIALDWYNCRPAPGLSPSLSNIKCIPLEGGKRQNHVANVANIVLVHSLLRSFPEVDASRTVFVGLSWGSWYGGCVAAVDSRFRGAIEIYCGDYNLGVTPDRALVNGRFLASAKVPMWWVVSTNDRHVTPDTSNAGFARCVKFDGVAIVNDLPHSHIGFNFDSVHRMAAYYTGSDKRLPKLGKPVIVDGWLTASVLDGGEGISSVKLGYTTSTNMPQWGRQWKYTSGHVADGKVRARLPAGTVKCYLAAYEKEETTYRDMCGTTVFVDVKPSDIAEKCPVSENVRGHENIEWQISYAYHLTDGKRDLPRVLLVGDSICNAYQGEVCRLLDGKMNVSYWISSYCVTSPCYMKFLSLHLEKEKYDVVLFNNGLHSLQTPTDAYAKGLCTAMELVRSKQPGAKIVWCSSTPLKDAAKTAKVKELNEAAANVVSKFGGIETNDLFELLDLLDREANWRDMFHHKKETCNMEAQKVADVVLCASR